MFCERTPEQFECTLLVADTRGTCPACDAFQQPPPALEIEDATKAIMAAQTACPTTGLRFTRGFKTESRGGQGSITEYLLETATC